MPVEVLLDLPRQESTDTHTHMRALLLRFFNRAGQRLFRHNFLSSSITFSSAPSKENILRGCDSLLDRFFAVNLSALKSSRGEELVAYLSPVAALLEGICAECRTCLSSGGNTKATALAAAKAILQALHQLVSARDYVRGSTDADFWRDVAETLRDKEMASKAMQDGFSIFIDCMFLSEEVRSEAGVIENSIRDAQNGHCSFHDSFMTGFGEAICAWELGRDRRNEAEHVSVGRKLDECLRRSFPSGMTPLRTPQYVSAYVHRTMTYVTEFMRRNQYALPLALRLVPGLFKSVLDPSGKTVCDSQFRVIIEKHLDDMRSRISGILEDFDSKSFSKKDVAMFNSTPILESLDEISKAWGLDRPEVL